MNRLAHLLLNAESRANWFGIIQIHAAGPQRNRNQRKQKSALYRFCQKTQLVTAVHPGFSMTPEVLGPESGFLIGFLLLGLLRRETFGIARMGRKSFLKLVVYLATAINVVLL